MGITKAKFVYVSAVPDGEDAEIEVLFNPTELSIQRGASYAEIAIPGLQHPLLQFVRGQVELLQMELFLDRSKERQTVTTDLVALRKLVTIQSELHSPPVVRFEWEETKFQGVVTSLQERFTLFNEAGGVERARVQLEMKGWVDVQQQRNEAATESPDRTESWVVQQGDRLDQIAARAYGDARQWRVIADANGIVAASHVGARHRAHPSGPVGAQMPVDIEQMDAEVRVGRRDGGTAARGPRAASPRGQRAAREELRPLVVALIEEELRRRLREFG